LLVLDAVKTIQHHHPFVKFEFVPFKLGIFAFAA
jgi:hypothetical protein